MKREDIYIEVTPGTVKDFLDVLRVYGEPFGDSTVTGQFNCLLFEQSAGQTGFWAVGIKPNESDVFDGTPGGTFSPYAFEALLKDIIGAEQPKLAEMAEPAEMPEPSEPVKTTTLLFTDAGTFEPVEVCKGWEVILSANGERKCVPTGRLYSCALKPLQP